MRSERHSHDVLRDLDATGKRRVPVLPEDRAPRPSGWLLWLAGLPGVVAVAWTILPALAAGRTLPVPLWAAVALSAAQSAALLALAVWLGNRCAPAVGLRAPLFSALTERTAAGPALRGMWVPGIVGGVLGAAILYAAPMYAPPALAKVAAAVGLPLYTRVLYGGITEELLLRWGFMGVALWLLWKAFGRRGHAPGPLLAGLAIVLSALAFGAGHLPAAAAIAGGLDPAIVLYVLAGNGVFGIVAGVLFWRYGLEAAMLAHALAHVFAWLVGR